MREYDFIVVGGGSAGCVLADRLSQNPDHTVCLIEAGPEDKSPFISIPLGVIALLRGKKHNWQYETEPQKELNNRRLFWPRGKVLGGSSSINAMVYIRGHQLDYLDWEKTVGGNWSLDNIWNRFKSHENNEKLGPSKHHGTGGPLNVTAITDPNPLSEIFINACQQTGIPLTHDFNGENQEGAGFYQVTQKDGRRWSSARAFLGEAKDRNNLTVLTDTIAKKIHFESKRATGIDVLANGVTHRINANKEIILSGGAINSPHLLLLSGVGSRHEMQEHGIPLVHELPGVGQNLQDHLDATIMIRDKSKQAIGIAPKFLLKGMINAVRYFISKRGIFASNISEAGGFVKLSKASPRPELQLHFIPSYLRDHGRQLVWGYGCTLHVCQLRPKSRGYIGLHSADPLKAAKIQPNYLSHPEDCQQLIQGIRIARKIMNASAFKSINAGEIEPGIDTQSDEELLDDLRQRAESIYHPVGSCKMGHDPMAVVDNRLRVHGISGLRVADASIMPTLIGGNTNAPSMMIGEMAARMIISDQADSNLDTKSAPICQVATA